MNQSSELSSHQMYSKILGQLSKGSLISILSESSKLMFLSNFYIGLFGLTFADNISCSMLWISPFVISSSSTLQCLSAQVFRHEIFQLCQCYYTYARDHSHIESSHSLCQTFTKFQNHPPSTLSFKMPNL